MQPTKIEARHLKLGDVIAVDGYEGSWTIEAMFVEGEDGPIDLQRVGDPLESGGAYQFEWFVSQDNIVECFR